MEHLLSFGNYESINEGVITRPGDPFEYKVEGDHWLARRKGSNGSWKQITGTDYQDKFQKSIDILDRENPKARTPKAPMKSGKGLPPKKQEPKKKEENSKSQTQDRNRRKPEEDDMLSGKPIGKIPRDWQPRSGVIFLPVEGKGDITRGSRLRRGTESENFPWRGLPGHLLGKRDPRNGINYLILHPTKRYDIEDIIEFIEDGNLDFIRTYTMIIVLWSEKFQIEVINQDINDVKKYLGITKTVSALPQNEMDEVNKVIYDEL
jgi:hypothetical protein